MYPNTARRRIRLAAASIVAAFVLAACGSSVEDEAGDEAEVAAVTTDATAAAVTTDAPAAAVTTDAKADETPTTDAKADDEMPLPAWQTIALTDVDGASFTLDDFHGTPVFVETFATWCPNCKKQLKDTNAAAEQLGDQAVFIALSVETDLSSGDVAEYAADNGFNAVRFAVMTPDALAAFVDGLGQSTANPPSTPKVVIDAMGHAGELTTGFESAGDIVAKVTGQS